MELRSSRSRSTTPFIRRSVEKEIDEDQIGNTIIRTTRSTTKIITSNFDNLSNNYNSLPQKGMKTRNTKSEKIVRKTRYKTSDYSSEDGDSELQETTNLEYLNNRSAEESRRSTSGSVGSVAAIDYYRAAGDYWNKYPKTDYTYSLYSKDRKEIAPGVLAMPNMSRRSLHGENSSNNFIISHKGTNTNVIEDEIDFTPTRNYKNNSEEILRARQRNLFSTNNNYEKYTNISRDIHKTSIYSRITNVFITVTAWILSVAYYMFRIQSSTIIWFGKMVHKIATRIMLWDTWLLQSVGKSNKLRSLLAVCFIPLFLFGGWWLLSQLGPLLYAKYQNRTANIFKNADHENIEIVIKDSFFSELPKTDNIPAELTSAQLQHIINEVKLGLHKEDFYNVDLIVNKIIQSPNMQHVFNNYKLEVNDDSTQTLLKHQREVIDTLKIEIDKIRLEMLQLEKFYNKDISDAITRLRMEYDQNMASLTYKLNRCCRNTAIPIESHVTGILKEFFQAPSELQSYRDISQWLRSTFVAKQDLETHLTNVTQHLHTNFDALIKNNGKVIMNKIMSEITTELNHRFAKLQSQSYAPSGADIKIDSISDQHIKRIVHDTLALYDADKTGLVDYALEPAGGEIISSKCTESYNAHSAVLSIFGIPIWYPSNTPRTAITPGVLPGECWAFQNFPGILVIKLTARIKVEAFSVEHMSKLLSPNGKIDSAPKEFSVYGLRNATDSEPIILGDYVYDDYGPPLQYFAVANYGYSFNFVQLKIVSNHGNVAYTCLYRFRVHGKLEDEAS